MAKRRVKPPGKEKWTWCEIDAGYKISRGQRSAAHRWEEINKAGPEFRLFAAIIVIAFALFAWIVGGMRS